MFQTNPQGEFGNVLEKATSGSGSKTSSTWTKGWTGIQPNGISGGSTDDSAVGLSANYSARFSAGPARGSDPIRLTDNSAGSGGADIYIGFRTSVRTSNLKFTPLFTISEMSTYLSRRT